MRTASDRDQLIVETLTALHITVLRAQGGSLRQFVHAIAHLRWRDPHVTSVVHTFAAAESATLNSRLPAVCRDISAWVASGYRRLSTHSVWPEAHAETLNEHLADELVALGHRLRFPGRAIAQVLARYTPRGKITTADVIRLEKRVFAKESRLLQDVTDRAERVLGFR